MRHILSATLLLSMSAPAYAQSPAQEWLSRTVLSFEFLRPYFEDGDTEFPTVAGFAAVRIPVAGFAVVGELPFATLSGGGETSRAIGNVMVAVEAARGDLTFTTGLRLPTAPENELALLAGFAADVQRHEAFLDDVLTLRLGIDYRRPRGSGFQIDAGGAAELLFLTADDGADPELLLDYGFQLIHRPRTWGWSGGIAGRAHITDSDLTLSQRTMHELRTGVDYTTSNLRPHAGIALPLDEDARDFVNLILRFGLQVAFR